MIFLLVLTVLNLQKLDVGQIEMKGDSIECSHGVAIEQRYGAFQAERLQMKLDSHSKPLNMYGEGDLELKLNNGGILKAPFAAFDGIGKVSTWFGTDLFKVQYADEKKGIELNCGRLELELLGEAPWTGRITALESPEIRTVQGDRVRADEAVLGGMDAKGTFTAVLLRGGCVLTRPSGDQIASREVAIDLNHRKATLSGESTLKIAGDEPRKITSHGTVALTKETIIMESPLFEGKVREADQIHLEDERGDLFADRAELDYEEKKGKWIPKKLLFFGNVRMIYREQYALADIAEVDFATETLYLRSLEREQVLFYDKLNQMQGAAKAMKLYIDPATRKVKIEAIGKMRVRLNETELAEIKKRMMLDGF